MRKVGETGVGGCRLEVVSSNYFLGYRIKIKRRYSEQSSVKENKTDEDCRPDELDDRKREERQQGS